MINLTFVNNKFVVKTPTKQSCVYVRWRPLRAGEILAVFLYTNDRQIAKHYLNAIIIWNDEETLTSENALRDSHSHTKKLRKARNAK